MSKSLDVNRRESLVLAVPLYAAGPQETSSRDEARLVEALCDQVIPADDAPGAKQAGVRRERPLGHSQLAHRQPSPFA
jgi:hypothetical protein